MSEKRILQLRTMPYVEYLKTPEWAEKRKQVLERDGYRCRACNSTEGLHIHHLTYKNRGNELLEELTCLCGPCHEHFHKKIDQETLMQRTYIPPVKRENHEEQVQKWEIYLVGLLIRNMSLLPYVRGIVNGGDFTHAEALAIYQLLNNADLEQQPFDVQDIPDELKSTASKSAELMSLLRPRDEETQIKEAVQVVTRMKRERLMEKSKELRDLSQEAIIAGDKESLRQYQMQVAAVHRQLMTLNAATRLQG